MKRIARLFLLTLGGLALGTLVSYRAGLIGEARAQVPGITDYAQCATGRVCVSMGVQTQGTDGGTQADFGLGGVIIGNAGGPGNFGVPTCNAARRGELRLQTPNDGGTDELCLCTADGGSNTTAGNFQWCALRWTAGVGGACGSSSACP